MARGKHSLHSYNSTYEDYEDEEIGKRKIILIVAAVIAVVAIVAFGLICVKNANENNENSANTVDSSTIAETMIATYEGYNVLGKISIDKIEVEQYILDSKEDDALESGVIKLYGGTLNNYGNFCIAGHNKTGIFERLNEMEVEDTFKIIEPNLTETTYRITEIYSAEADDLKSLLQDDEKIEITLITCENGSTTRLIVKAEEVI